MKFEKSYVNISFKDVVNGLISKNGSQFIKGFQLIDREGNVLKSIAKIITKNKVSVKTESDSEIIELRYAWGNSPKNTGLYNSEMLPAIPFRINK